MWNAVFKIDVRTAGEAVPLIPALQMRLRPEADAAARPGSFCMHYSPAHQIVRQPTPSECLRYNDPANAGIIIGQARGQDAQARRHLVAANNGSQMQYALIRVVAIKFRVSACLLYDEHIGTQLEHCVQQ